MISEIKINQPYKYSLSYEGLHGTTANKPFSMHLVNNFKSHSLKRALISLDPTTWMDFFQNLVYNGGIF